MLLWLWLLDSRWLWNIPYPKRPSHVCTSNSYVSEKALTRVREGRLIDSQHQFQIMDEGLEIDEHHFMIGHYWRRRDALYSSIGKITISFNACLFVYALVLLYQITVLDIVNEISKFLIFHAVIEVATYTYIFAILSLFVTSKGLSYILFKIAPWLLIKWKRWGERKHKMIRNPRY
ncbi:UNKNOWN [Stylonychia lemnae]|uniref:Uncharacterized protein n=1 Tax=Stylonychia lemnae TaxID=5949 RepID=A0A078B2C2_STYLE|nr:UNKNOWN [Stylonychia lemnae]|eukprot:CDW88695.1 UNKNOWN [Stylonychia lemnae]